ncbi:hypothetical protein NL676_009454 [Syzygium grande]|nr:hypothetical protein NL676_009454 [Syzygium grande]
MARSLDLPSNSGGCVFGVALHNCREAARGGVGKPGNGTGNRFSVRSSSGAVIVESSAERACDYVARHRAIKLKIDSAQSQNLWKKNVCDLVSWVSTPAWY